MFRLQAPYPGISTTMTLPSPQFSNGEGLTVSVTSKRAIDGSLRTYIKRQPRRRLDWTFNLARMKALELRAFIQQYHSRQILVTDHNGVRWRGFFTVNPFEFDTTSRFAPGGTSDGVRAELQTIRLQFEGFKL